MSRFFSGRFCFYERYKGRCRERLEHKTLRGMHGSFVKGRREGEHWRAWSKGRESGKWKRGINFCRRAHLRKGNPRFFFLLFIKGYLKGCEFRGFWVLKMFAASLGRRILLQICPSRFESERNTHQKTFFMQGYLSNDSALFAIILKSAVKMKWVFP